MGYGGDLLWSAALREYRAHNGKRVALALKPKLTDLLCGRLYDGTELPADRPIFAGSPDVCSPTDRARSKSNWSRQLDSLFDRVVSRLGLENWLERLLSTRSAKYSDGKPYRLIYMDTGTFSYARSFQQDRIFWKEEPNAVAAILEGFPAHERPPLLHPQPPGSLHELDPERRRVASLLASEGLEPGRYVAIEPDTNREWFGDLRAWPWDYWQLLIDQMIIDDPSRQIVQTGVGDKPLRNVVDLRGQTTFREAAALIETSALFIGTEGGLMHAAGAVRAQSLIIWGGVTEPTFAGLPNRQLILFNRLECTPCGYRNSCPYDKACIRGISVEQVFSTVQRALADYDPGIIDLSER
jgi:ADP-heptose:LPS heptosyltransferase